MAILAGDIKLLKSAVLDDVPEGGGMATGSAVVDGQSNNLFPDISELDRTYGRISLRKAFPAVLTDDVDTYFGSNVIVAKPPTDGKVSVCLFSTKNWYDKREDARNRLEQYLAPSSRWAGHLLEAQLEGARAIQMLLKPGDALPEVGRTLYLAQDEGKATFFYQYVRVTKIEATEKAFTHANGTKWIGVVVTVTISDPLRYSFEGLAATPYEQDMAAAKAKVRDTIVADAAKYYSIAALSDVAHMGELTVKVASIYGQLVPSAQSEIPLVDLDAGGQSQPVIQSGANEISYTIAYAFGTGKQLYLGTGVFPGTLRLTNGSSTISDESGRLKVSGSEVGTIDYGTGVLTFASGAWSGTTTVRFKPAAAPVRVVQTAALRVTQNDRGYTWTMNLAPPPPPKSLVVAYRTQGKWYELKDAGPVSGGTGKLEGADSSIGTGSLNYATGSVVLTLGALPDADSQIMFFWSTRTNCFDRTTLPIPRPYQKIQLAHPGVIPSTCTLSWPNPAGGAPLTATDDGKGSIIGAATGTIRYQTGEIKFAPAVVPLGGSTVTVAYAWGQKQETTFAHPTRDINGLLNLTIPGGNIIPGTVEVEWNTLYMDYDATSTEPLGLQTIQATATPRDPTEVTVDVPQSSTDGVLKGREDASAIDYETGAVQFNPDGTASIPKPQYASEFMGFQVKDVALPVATYQFTAANPEEAAQWIADGQGQNPQYAHIQEAGAPIYRNVLTGVTYQEVATLFPADETGYVKVRYLSQQSANNVEEQFTLSKVAIDLTADYGEKVVSSSTRFTYGGKTYVDRIGQLFTDIDPATGAGTLAGTISYTNGTVELTVFPSGGSNQIAVQSLLTEQGNSPCDYVIFRVPSAPVRSGTFQIRGTRTDGTTFSVTAQTNGKIAGQDIAGNIDYLTGIVEIRFGGMAGASLLGNASYYNPSEVTSNGAIFVPRPVWIDTLRYNAVGYTYLPLDADVLGLDPVRLPPDGRVPIFRAGDVAVVHNTARYQLASPAAGASYNVGRERLASLKVVDSAGTAAAADKYTADLDAGTLTLAAGFSTAGLVTPLYAESRIEDMALVSDVQINGLLTLTRTLSHDFPLEGSYVSSALIMGDLHARVQALFDQASWTGAWSDTRIGDAATATYNSTQYPVEVSNRGAIQERWLIQFATNGTVNVIGESVGQIVTNHPIVSDLAPENPATGVPYFTMRAAGWGQGWAAGNLVRLNTVAANYPVWIARTVLQGNPTHSSDQFTIGIRGDVDA